MKNAFVALTTGLMFFHYLNLFLGTHLLLVEALFALGVLFLGFFLADVRQVIYAAALLTAAQLILWFEPPNPGSIITGFTQLDLLIGLIVLTPVLGLVFDLRKYVDALVNLAARYIKNESGLYSSLTILYHIISSMLLVGSVPLMHEIMERMAPKPADERSLRMESTSILQAFSTAGLWSPNFALVGLALTTGAKWRYFFPYALTLAFLALAAGIYLQRRLYHGDPRPFTGQVPAWPSTRWDEKTTNRRAFEFGLFLLAFIGLVVGLEEVTGYGIISLVPSVALVVTTAIYTATTGPANLLRKLGTFLFESITEKANLLIIIIPAGFLGYALTVTGLGQDLFGAFQQAVAAFSLDLLVALPLLIVALGFVGLDPVILLSIMAGSGITSTITGVSPLLLSLALVSGGAVSLAVAPFAGSTLIVANQVRRDPLTVGPKWNWPFGLSLFVLGQILIQVLQRFS